MKTVYPKDPIENHKEWRKYIAKKAMSPEEIFEADFMRIWTTFKRSIINARTKK